MKCPLRALIEGQLSALARLEKTENVHFGKIFTSFSPKCIYYPDLEGLSVFLSSLIWKLYKKYSWHFKFLHFPSPCSVAKLALHQRPHRPLHATPGKLSIGAHGD